MNANETRPEIIEQNGKMLCKNCAALNQPGADFYVKCGAPLSSYSTVGPFESIFAQGFAYRQAAENPRRAIVVLGIWMIFLPIFFPALYLIGSEAGPVWDLVAGSLALLSFGIVARTTWNYFSAKRAATAENSRRN